MNQNTQFQMSMPLTPMVRNIIVINICLWLGLVLILQNYFLDQPYIFQWFGLNPDRVIFQFWLWQPLTYMFLHSESVFHILFNMLVVWLFGSELESRWGAKAFLFYYLACGVGGAVIHLLSMVVYLLVSGSALPLMTPVVGASGATFGLMLAYGILFGDRVIYFMMMFPMKARYFAILLGVIEVLNLLSEGLASPVAYLAHIGGLISGYLVLVFWSRWKADRSSGNAKKHGRRLKLVVDNEKPKYWN